MVYLSKIYTKTGDDGTTGLGDGSRAPKDDPRIDAYGDVDELNACLGILLAQESDFSERALIESISNDLFDVGADLCVPQTPEESAGSRLRIVPAQVSRLEAAIDRLNEPLPPLTSFVLPGGTAAAGWCHLARTVCRRAERRVVALSRSTHTNPWIAIYLNRLSDLLFVLARTSNQAAGGDVLWQPGQNRHRDGEPLPP